MWVRNFALMWVFGGAFTTSGQGLDALSTVQCLHGGMLVRGPDPAMARLNDLYYFDVQAQCMHAFFPLFL